MTPDSPNPDPILGQKMSFSDLAFKFQSRFHLLRLERQERQQKGFLQRPISNWHVIFSFVVVLVLKSSCRSQVKSVKFAIIFLSY